MTGLVTLLFNPVTIFGLLFLAFGVKNLITRHYASAVIYLIASLSIILGGAWLLGKVATSRGQMPVVLEEPGER